ncbi:MAG: Dabb family protein [Clostridia bacterium]
MIKHIVFTKFSNPEENVPVARELLQALPAQIPQIISLETGADFLHSDRSFDMALIVLFETEADLKIYDQHPAHAKVRAYIREHRTASATVDFTF